MIDFYFKNNTKQKIPQRYFLFCLKNALEKLGIENPIEVSLIIVDSKAIRSLNKKYRNKNEETDVLSFPIDLIKPKDIKKFKKNDKIILGDIYICSGFIKKNSPDNFLDELKFAFLHGLIHLMGYNHKNKEDRIQWQKTIEKIIN